MNRRVALIIGVAALLLGAVGPWVSALGVISVGPTQSIETSVVVFGGIAVLALFAILDKRHRIVSIIIGSLALSEALYTYIAIQQAKADAHEWGALFGPGWGLYLTILTGLFLIASTFIVKPSVSIPAPTPVAVTIEDKPGSVPPPSQA